MFHIFGIFCLLGFNLFSCQGAAVFPPFSRTSVTTSYEVAVEKPTTLVLKNVNLTDNGTYQSSLSPGREMASNLVVHIAVTPKVTSCSSPIIVNEGDNVSCTCQGQGGNPPADVTWYKKNHKIGETGKEEKTLTLTNVMHKKDHGSYKCVAQSYPNEKFQDEVIVEVIINYPPQNVVLTLTKNCSSATVECSAEAQPPASFKIFRNKRELVKYEKTYTIPEVCSSHVGNYTCVADNILGNVSSNSEYLSIQVRSKDNGGGGGSSTGLSTDAIARTCVNVGLLLVIVIIVVRVLRIIVVRVHRWLTGNAEDGRNRATENECSESYTEDGHAYEALEPVAPGREGKASPVYVAVDRENRQGEPLYATLDTVAMIPKKESKKQPVDGAPHTIYASIDFEKDR